MRQSTYDLTTGSLGKGILRFSVPLMCTNVLQVLFNMADVAVVGQFAGSIALGAVGSTVTVVNLFTGFLIGMSGGLNVLVARHYGGKREQDTRETVHCAAVLFFITGVLFLLGAVLLSRWVLALMNTKEELIHGATLYLRIYFLGMPALAIYNFGNAVFSAIGDTKRPLRYLSVAGVVNVTLNLFFVVVCHLDVAGVAIASVVSQYISAGLILRALLRSRESYGIHPTQLRVHREKAKDILVLGVPAGMQNAIFHISNMFIQVGVNTFSAVVVAGNAAAANADGLVYDVMAAFYTACGSFMGQNYGAGKADRVLRSYGISLAYSFGVGCLMGGGLVLFGQQFLSLFAREPEVIEAGMVRMTIMGLSYGFSAFMECTIAAARGLGKSIVPAIIVILGSCVFRIVWIYTVFARFGTLTSLYLLYIVSWAITAVVAAWYLKIIYKQQMSLLNQPV